MRLQQDAHYIAQILDNFKRRLRIIHGEVSYNIFDTLLIIRPAVRDNFSVKLRDIIRC
ncbi:Uncharacterised protein [Yersinia frederiksenii]|nr:Uncharacterised protein [Yersinia frederiksenii]